MPYRILIADDDMHTRRILETLLSREPSLRGPDIVSAADGQEAFASLEKVRPDLVITDLLMPRMDGFAFARALRQHKNGIGIPLLVTSAIYKDRVSLGRLEQETGCEFYAKPYQLRDLVRAVVRHLAEPGRQRPVRRAGTKNDAPRVLEGSLSDRGLPRLLLDLFDMQATGVLSLTRARLKKEIYILLGHPIGADSNLRNETLGQMLLARGVLDPAMLQQALDLSRARDRLGAILIEKGWMKESEVLKYLGAQVRLKIVTALRWGDGEYRFLPGDSFSGRMTHLTVDAPRMVFSGLKRSARSDEISRAARWEQGAIAIDGRFERHREAFVSVFGDSGLPATLSGRKPPQLVEKNESELLIQWEALRLTGLATLSPVEAEEASAPDAADSSRPLVARVHTNGVPGDRSEARADALYRQLFNDEDSGAVPPPPAPPMRDLEREDSGLFMLPTAPSESGVPSTPRSGDPSARVARDALLREYLLSHGQDHYRLLHVERDASPQEISRAYSERREKFRLERFSSMDLGVDHARLETMHQAFEEAFKVLSDGARRAAYDRSLGASRGSAHTPARKAIDAESYFREGLRLLGSEDMAGAATQLRRAIEAAPDQADYHASLGWALFQSRDPHAPLPPAASTARAALEQALAIDPDHAAAHEFLGRLLFVMGDDATATEHLERALQLDPGRPEALAAVAAAYLRAGNATRLERVYRAQIAALGDTGAAGLWWSLALLLRDHRGDLLGARQAFDTYVRLVPDDGRAREALARLRMPAVEERTTARRIQVSATLRAAWHSSPSDPVPGKALFHLFVEADRPDAALTAASALLARGMADDEVLAFAKRYRPRFLLRAISPLAWPQVDSLRHPDDDRDLATLYTRLFLAAPPELSITTPVSARPPEALPPTFAQLLGYVTWMLGVAPPRVEQLVDIDGLGLRVVPDGSGGVVLRAGPAALAQTDKIALAFRLGRALSALYPARACALSLSSQRLKSYLSAATALFGTAVHGLDEESQKLTARLAGTPHLAGEIRPILERLAARNAPINLSRWVRGLGQTAERIGLVLCNDTAVAARILGEENVSTDPLIDFSLSDELATLREALGLTIAV